VARRPRAHVRRADDTVAALEIRADTVAAVRVIAEGDDVRAGREQPVGELRGDAGSVGGVLPVDDADVGAELLAQRGEPVLDGAPAGDAEDICKKKNSQLRTSAGAGRSSTDT
jgi:hypothetical protein